MNTKFFARTLTLSFIALLITPTVFFIAPQRTSAQAASLVSAASCLGLTNGAASLATNVATKSLGLAVPVSDAITQAQTAVSAGANSTDCMTTSIMMPLARMLARIVLQQITASTINWINGSNGTGRPSFVTNLSIHLQTVGDSVALPFIGMTANGFNSPFGLAISSALRTNYLQQTSMAGFFSANQCTLSQSSPNPNAFLAGNWSQGGIPAWFALTTQNQNNPYTLYQAAESQLGKTVNQAEANRRQELQQSGGFLSWCAPSDTAAASEEEFPVAGGVNPGDSCYNSDGTQGQIQTPGAIIHDYTQQAVVNSGISQLVSAQDLDSALGAIATALGNQLLGSAGGLLGASQPSSSRPSLTSQLQNYAAGGGSSGTSASSIGGTKLSQITAYTNAWDTIVSATNVASTSLVTLMSYCNAQATSTNASATAISTQVSAAQMTLATKIAPVLAQAKAAYSSAATTQKFALKVQAEAAAVAALTSVNSGAAAALTADTQTLATMPPSVTDIVSTQQNAQTSGGSKANPDGSLAVSGGSLVDQMSLISTNATALQSACAPVAPARRNTDSND